MQLDYPYCQHLGWHNIQIFVEVTCCEAQWSISLVAVLCLIPDFEQSGGRFDDSPIPQSLWLLPCLT